MKNILKRISLFALLAVVFSCQKEEVNTTTSVDVSNFVKQNLKLKDSENSNIASNLDVNYANYKKHELENATIYEVELTEKMKSTIESDFLKPELRYSLLVLEKDGILTGYLLEVYTMSGSLYFPSTLTDLDMFSGYAYVYDMKGKRIDEVVFSKNNVSNPTNNPLLNDFIFALNDVANKNNNGSIQYKIPACNYLTTMWTSSYTEWYTKVSNAEGVVLSVFYSHTQYLGTSVSYVNVPYPCDSTPADEKHIVHTGKSYNAINIDDIVVEGPDIAITNMADYLDCFNLTQGATITVYASKPTDGNYLFNIETLSPGHGFISIQQGNSVVTLGFYPISTAGSLSGNTPGVFGNDQNHPFHSSISIPINSATLNNIVSGLISSANNGILYKVTSKN